MQLSQLCDGWDIVHKFVPLKADARVLNAVLFVFDGIILEDSKTDPSRADVPFVETKKTLADLCVAFGIWKKKENAKGWA